MCRPAALRACLPSAFEDAQLESRLHVAQLANGRMVERHHRAFLHRAQLAEHVDELLLETGIHDGQLLDLDDQADLAQRQLDHVVEKRDAFALAGVELHQLGGGVITYQAVSVGRAIEGVVVDDHQPSIRREVDVALDQVAAGRDRGTKRAHRVFGVVGRVAPVAAEQWATVIVGGLVASADGFDQAPESLVQSAAPNGARTSGTRSL